MAVFDKLIKLSIDYIKKCNGKVIFDRKISNVNDFILCVIDSYYLPIDGKVNTKLLECLHILTEKCCDEKIITRLVKSITFSHFSN